MNKDRMTPEEFAKFLLKEHTCKNCKWWNQWRDEKDRGECNHSESLLHVYTPFVTKEGKKPYVVLAPCEDFGCNQWEVK